VVVPLTPSPPEALSSVDLLLALTRRDGPAPAARGTHEEGNGGGVRG
jgi:hypothetical protein